MQYIGIDIAKHAHVAAARFEDGAPHGKAFEFANDEEGFKSLLGRLRERRPYEPRPSIQSQQNQPDVD